MRSPEVLSKMEIEKERERDYAGFIQTVAACRGGGGRGGLINNKIRNQKLNECPFVIMPAGADNADDDDDDAACVSACLPLSPPFLPCLPAPLSTADGKTSAFTRLLMPHCGTLSNNCNKWTCPGRETAAAPPALPLPLSHSASAAAACTHVSANFTRSQRLHNVSRCLHSLSRSLILPLLLALLLPLLLLLLLPRLASLIKQNK